MCTHGGGASMVTQSSDTDLHQWTRNRFMEHRGRASCCERLQAARDFWAVDYWVEGGTATAQGLPWRPAPCRPRLRRRDALGPRALARRYQRTGEGVYSLLPRGAAQSCKYDSRRRRRRKNSCHFAFKPRVPFGEEFAVDASAISPPASYWSRWFLGPSNQGIGGARLLARA